MMKIKRLLFGTVRPLRFYKYFISYILLLVVTLAVLSGVVYRGFISTLRSEVEASNISSLDQVRSTVDTRMKELERIALNINTNSFLKPYKLTGSAYDSVEAVRELGKYKSGSEFIDDILLYYDYNNSEHMTYTSETWCSLDMMFNAYYIHENWDKEQFLDMTENIRMPFMRPAEEVKVFPLTIRKLAAYVYPLSINSSKPYGVVVFYIKQNTLKSMIKNVLKEYRGYTYILDEDKNPIVYVSEYETGLDPLDILESIKLESSQSPISNLRIHNTDYSILRLTSDYNNWSYVTVMPTGQFMNKVYTRRSIFNYMIFAALVLGTAMAFILAVENYKPLRKLLNSLSGENKNESISRKTDEFAYIFRIFSEMSKENKDFGRKRFLLGLLRKQFSDACSIRVAANDYGIYLDRQFFRVVVFLIDDFEQFKNNNDAAVQGVMKFSLTDTLEGLAQNGGYSYSYGIELPDERSVALILNYDAEFNHNSSIDGLVCRVKDIFKQFFTFTVGVGEAYGSIDMVRESFLQANRAVNYRFIKGKDNIIFFDDIKESRKSKYKYPVKIEGRLIMAIKQGNGDEVERIIKEFWEYIMGQSMSIESVQCIYFGIINAVARTLDEMEIDSNQCFSAAEESLFIKPYETIDNLLERIAEYCRGACRYIVGQKESKNYALRDKILEILKNHYHDNMLSLESIADQCGMSPSYISRFFKDHIGSSPTQYLDMLRMEEAKGLLKSTRLGLKEIIDKVGYISEANFIRKFKKIEGVTPMQYRIIAQTGDDKTK